MSIFRKFSLRVALLAALGSLLVVGTGIAASRYLITSTNQIKPSVLAQLKGQRGPRGFTGKVIQGKSDTGVTGAQGNAGPQGLNGNRGEQGVKGDTGKTGAPGRDGSNGADGAPGTDAAQDAMWAPFSSAGINGGGWRMTSTSYNATIVGGSQLQLSDAVTSGSFGDWVFSPSVPDAQRNFTATFNISTAPGARNTDASGQWNHISISPDNGEGGRMSYLRFENHPDGVHVFFDDTPSATLVGGSIDFREADIATLKADQKHVVRFAMSLTPGDNNNDVVKVYIDGQLKETGTSWKLFYLHDPEQAPNHVPTTNSLIMQARGTGNPADEGKGYLIDSVRLASS